MKLIKDYKDGDRVMDIYLVKYRASATTKNGKVYENVILQDKSGTMDAKIWEPNSPGIADFDALDYVEVYGEVTSFNGALQVSIKRVRKCKEEEYNTADYLPCTTKNIDEMHKEIVAYIDSIKTPPLRKMLRDLFVEDQEFKEAFCYSSAAKSVHHGFVGGLLEHTLSVVNLCNYYCTTYPVLRRDLLLAAALCHDIGKVKELSPFPENSYTDDGQLLGHFIIGIEIVGSKIRNIPDFPPVLASELKHCILAHHGEHEYGSPKKPAIVEAMALFFADNTDAKMQTFSELLADSTETGWLGFQRLFDSNVRRTSTYEG